MAFAISKLLRNTFFVGWILVSLICISISASIWAVVQTQKAAAMTYKAATATKQLATQTAAHKRAISINKAKARLRRIIIAIPVAGAAAAIGFEEKDRRDWLAENPDKDSKDYACHIAEVTAEIADEVIGDLPVGDLPWSIAIPTPKCDIKE